MSLVTLFVQNKQNTKVRFHTLMQTAVKRCSGKKFAQVYMGKITKPTTIVDMHGKILMWYLSGLLLPHRVVCFTFLFKISCPC